LKWAIQVVSGTTDHGRADWLGYWDEFVQKARLKKLDFYVILSKTTLLIWDEFVCLVLSVSTGIYGGTYIYLISGFSERFSVEINNTVKKG